MQVEHVAKALKQEEMPRNASIYKATHQTSLMGCQTLFCTLLKEPPSRKSAYKIHKARKYIPAFMLTIYVSCEVHFHARQPKERKNEARQR